MSKKLLKRLKDCIDWTGLDWTGFTEQNEENDMIEQIYQTSLTKQTERP